MDPAITIALLFGFIGLGVASKFPAKRYTVLNRAIHILSNFIYYVLLPAVFVDTFALRGLELADVNITLIAIIYTLASVTLLLLILHGFKGPLRNAVIITSIFQNNVFLGFPVLLLLFNDISAAAMYSLIIFILHITISGLLAAAGENILVSIAKIPIIYGFLGGTLIHYFALNQYHIIAPYMTYTHSILSYSAVYILGYTLPLTLSYIHGYIKCFYTVTAWRFLASPAIHYLLMLFLTLPSLYWKEVMVLSIMPPAVMNTVIARIYGWEPEFVASTTLVLTLISLIIIAGILFIAI